MNQFIKSSSGRENYLETSKEVCFIGRSNVGKSSLINAIFKQKISRVSKTPGRTRLINFFSKDGNIMVDLPGYGYAKISKTLKSEMDSMVKEYFIKRNELRCAFILIDGRIGVTPLDKMVISFLSRINREYFIVVTKKDKCKQSEISKTTVSIKKHTNKFLFVSSIKYININKLNNIIEEYLKD